MGSIEIYNYKKKQNVGATLCGRVGRKGSSRSQRALYRGKWFALASDIGGSKGRASDPGSANHRDGEVGAEARRTESYKRERIET